VDYVRMLRDHLTIASMGGSVDMSVIEHVDGPDHADEMLDGTLRICARVAQRGAAVHDPGLLGSALVRQLGLVPKRRATMPPPRRQSDEARQDFEARLVAARRLLRGSE